MIYKFGKHEIEIYESIKKLPILTFQLFNKYQMIAAEIGNTFDDYDRRTQKVLAFLAKGMTKEAVDELNNQRQTAFNAYNGQSPFGKSFATLINRIDDVKYETVTSDDLDQILLHLNKIGFDIETSINLLTEVKKKSKWSWLFTFLESFRKTRAKKQPRYDTTGQTQS